MDRVRRPTAAAIAAAALLVIVHLSYRVTWRSSSRDAAELRVSWRIPAPSHRVCRPPTEAEVRGVLPHMRPPEVCTDEAIPHRLTIRLNGSTLYSEPVERSGPRARTITVYRSFPLAPGDHDLKVAFLPEPAAGAGAVAAVAAAADPAEESADSARGLAMTLAARMSVAPGDVVLVSRDENGRLMARSPSFSSRRSSPGDGISPLPPR